ncbi:hypothetical protein FB45DRAFT_916228 [Roridomyces roridus]|uniref:Uncharacterized protein n=1 Tax=Roridomyces roridus TaxID=1738132 RepID=A0AAD7FP53_9AGAR|nr:hypothetical protein FB45DRAFT_916228 [Roridomyces roridus]
MSLHELHRAGLETIHVLHCPPSSPHSLSAGLDGYIMVPKDRLPLADKLNAQHVLPRSATSKPAKEQRFDATIDQSYTLITVSRPSTPFEPLPPLLATSPLRLSSFLDTVLQSSDPEPVAAPPESPPSRPARRTPKKLDIFFNPNSPYAPLTPEHRRAFLRPLTPASQVSAYSRPYSRSGARAPEPDSPLPAGKFLRLSKSFKNLRRTVKEGVRHVKNALGCNKASKAKTPQLADDPVVPPPVPPLPSPVQSCGSSTHTTTLAEWLRDCEANIERSAPNLMTLEEYEERGSWLEGSSIQDESEIHSLLMTEDDHAEPYPHLAPTSPTCTDTSTIPPLSMWPAPPQSVTPSRVFSRQMSMPGGWNLRESPA